MAGKNGTIKSISSEGTVVVSFPTIDPPPDPGQTASIQTYVEVDGEALDLCKMGLANDAIKIDTTGTAPTVGVVTAHR